MAITKHVYQIFIKATPEQVWNAIIEPSWTRRYFHGTAFDSPPVKGEPYRTTLAGGQPGVDGVIEELDPPKRLVMTWHTLYDAAMAEEPPSRVEWIVEPMGEGLTRLRLEHGDLARSPLTWANVKDGWEYVLDGLKTVLETGESLPPLTAALAPIEDAAGEWHRAQGIECNNSTWEMIEAARTPANDEEMLRRAHRRTTKRCCGAHMRRPITGLARCVVDRPTMLAERGCSQRSNCSSGNPNCPFVTPTAACRPVWSTGSSTSIWRTPTRPGLER